MANKRIGLVMANIHAGWAQNAWPPFARAALLEKVSLFIFPGGRVNSPLDTDSFRNPVYSLVNSDNLDGLFCWSSCIRYRYAKEAFDRFHENLDPLPYITLEYKIPGHINVSFDSYTAMKYMVDHCKKDHGEKKSLFYGGRILTLH